MADTNDNVIQFPGKKRENDPASQNKTVKTPPPPQPKPAASTRSLATVVGAVMAVMFATGAVNRYAFSTRAQVQSFSASSVGGARTIASVEANTWKRDADWEKRTAERLASVDTRAIASTHIGRPASLEDRLRFGVLDDAKYSFSKPDARLIQAISLQGDGSEPAYIGDSTKFLNDYGSLLTDAFASAQLKSVETGVDQTIEDYILYNKDQRPAGEALLQLDRYHRLLSLKVEPAQI